MSPALFTLQLLAYILAARLILRHTAGSRREVVFTLLNLAGVAWFVFYCDARYPQWNLHRLNRERFGVFVMLVGLQYLVLRRFAARKGAGPWVAFAFPLVLLAFSRYFPVTISTEIGRYFHLEVPNGLNLLGFMGVSYLAFRCSRLVLEIRNGAVEMPHFWQYMGFAFFVPTMSVGPINTYANYRRGFAAEPVATPWGSALLRIGVGVVKYKFLGSFFGQTDYAGLILDDHCHAWMDLPVAMVSYYLYLYCNFSGFCDMAIGAAALIGIPVPENFDDPLLARNMREFWNRWHITLSQWMRDVVFAPLSKYLVGQFGPARANHAIALTIAIVFLLIGVWHGVGWNYAAFGLAQALGVVAVHYYTIFLKKKLGRDGFKAYNENRLIHGLGVVMTFCYYAATLFLFANTGAEMKQILSVLR